MDRRSYTEAEIDEIIELSLKANTNLAPYLCKENFSCRFAIFRALPVVIKYKIVPEKYWHGSQEDFEWMLVLLSSDYPYPEEVLRLGAKGTPGEIFDLASHYFQYVSTMFAYVKPYNAGYDILRPTSYMLALYPYAKNNLFVYTHDIWANCKTAGIERPFLVFPEDELENASALIKQKMRSMTGSDTPHS